MWNFIVPAAMAGVSALSAEEKNKQKAKDRKAQAEVARWSPWTSLTPQQVGANDSLLGAGVGGAASGVGLMQAYDASKTPKSKVTEDPTTNMAGDPQAPPEDQGYDYLNTQPRTSTRGRQMYG